MQILRRKSWEIPESRVTPEHVFLNRRSFMAAAAAGVVVVLFLLLHLLLNYSFLGLACFHVHPAASSLVPLLLSGDDERPDMTVVASVNIVSRLE